jgi:holo-[acyl-carrier protein] synthase
MTIAGIGIDIVEISRVRAAATRTPGERFARKVLADGEFARYQVLGGHAAPQAIAYLAKRFAAKEAFFKAYGQPSSQANTWHQLAIENDARGTPIAKPGPLLAAELKDRGLRVWVSLSDERRYAAAQVILETIT